MDVSLMTLIALRRITTGRRQFAVQAVKRLADPETEARLVQLCDAALAHDEGVARLQAAYRQQAREKRNASEPSAAVLLDRKVDRVLSALDGKVASEAQAYEEGSAEARSLESLRAFLFPRGVGAIAFSSHVEALELVRQVLQRATERSAELESLGAQRLVARLRSLHEQFASALQAESSDLITTEQVAIEANKGNRLLRGIVAHILDLTANEDSSEAMARRTTLLGPILTQNEAMYVPQGKRATDVDPRTGVEVEAAEAE